MPVIEVDGRLANKPAILVRAAIDQVFLDAKLA